MLVGEPSSSHEPDSDALRPDLGYTNSGASLYATTDQPADMQHLNTGSSTRWCNHTNVAQSHIDRDARTKPSTLPCGETALEHLAYSPNAEPAHGSSEWAPLQAAQTCCGWLVPGRPGGPGNGVAACAVQDAWLHVPCVSGSPIPHHLHAWITNSPPLPP